MSLERRDWLVALPALLTLLLYAGVVLRPARRSMVALRAESARLGSPAEQAQRLEQARATARANAAGGAVATAADPAVWAASRQTAALQEISRLCASNGVALLAAAPVPEADAAAAVLRQAVERSGRSGPSAWRLETRAAFPAMAALLDSLAGAPFFALPAAVSLEAGAGEGAPLRWKLTLWL